VVTVPSAASTSTSGDSDEEISAAASSLAPMLKEAGASGRTGHSYGPGGSASQRPVRATPGTPLQDGLSADMALIVSIERSHEAPIRLFWRA